MGKAPRHAVNLDAVRLVLDDGDPKNEERIVDQVKNGTFRRAFQAIAGYLPK